VDLPAQLGAVIIDSAGRSLTEPAGLFLRA
jgi:hypothetical protein